MKGKYRIIIENKKIKYDFEIRRNITIIKGDSATGKTTLVDMVGDFFDNGESSGISLRCEKTCAVLSGKNWKALLDTFHNSILFIDEGNSFVSSKEFASAVKGSDNYFVIVTRESLHTLPYSVKEIYGIRNSGKYGTIKQTYNELYNIYGTNNINQNINPYVIITEDSNSGFQFFEHICKNTYIKCISANGKSNIFSMLQKMNSENVFIIADGAAFGSEMEKVMSLLKIKKSVYLYLPESFEWLILNSGIIKDSDIKKILEKSYDYIDSKTYVSWERYFTALLTERTKNTYLAYNKHSLNDVYITETVSGNILKQIKELNLKKE